jgi:hypothetical protein
VSFADSALDMLSTLHPATVGFVLLAALSVLSTGAALIGVAISEVAIRFDRELWFSRGGRDGW